MTELRYDPIRVAALRVRVAAAFHHLGRLASDDPAAASALRVAAGVRARIETAWLPAIDRVLASAAMLSWSATAPTWARNLHGAALGRALAAHARGLLRDSREEPVAAMIVALRDAADDAEAMSTLFDELGPAGLLELLTALATADPTTTALPAALRSAFVDSCTAGGLGPGFVRDLVAAAADAHVHSGGDGTRALTLAYLLAGEQLPTPFLVAAVRALLAAEQRHAGEHGLDPDAGWTLWTVGFRPPHALASAFTEPSGLVSPAAGDPLYPLLGQLARDGAAGRVVFADPDVASYVFGRRDVLADGGAAVVAAAAEAAAGAGLGADAPPYVLAQASLVASGFVNHFGTRNAARTTDATASLAAARVVGAHLYAVDVTLAAPDVRDEERVRTLPAADRAALEHAGVVDADGAPTRTVMATALLAHDVLGAGDPRRAALFRRAPLGQVVDLAARTDAGAGLLREALATYQRGLAQAAAARLAAGEIERPDRYLAEVTADAARLDARIGRHVGLEAERRGRAADATTAFWINAIGSGTDRLGDLLGRPGATVVRTVTRPVAGAATTAFADAEEDAAADADERARLASEQLVLVWARELHDAGVVDVALPVELAPDGRLPSYADLVRRVLQHPDWTMERVLHTLDVAPSRIGVELDVQAMRDAMASAQLPAYRELD